MLPSGTYPQPLLLKTTGWYNKSTNQIPMFALRILLL